MVFKSFRYGIAIRTFFLAFFIFATIFSSYKYQWYVTTATAGILSLILVIEIIRYAEKYKRSLSNFILSIKARDYSSLVRNIDDKNSRDILKQAYNTVIEEFRNIQFDKEIKYHYLKTIIEHIKTALLSFDKLGKIEFINKTASDLLGLSANQNIQKLNYSNNKLYSVIKNLKSGDSELIKSEIDNELLHLSIYATEFKIQENTIKLISLKNITSELNYQELESWQKLIRVLTHEIMNSVTPISSLSNAINETIQENNESRHELAQISDDDFEDIVSSLKTIETRSKGLLRFVSSYKQLTRIPTPDFKLVNLIELLNHCKTLLNQKIKKLNINFSLTAQADSIKSFVDYDLIEQVVINLLINAIDAVAANINPQIQICVKTTESKTKIIIKDNGKGIKAEDLDKIFIPFYTSKKQGSGIGLSLSRQIMRLHKGNIYVNSAPKKGSEFILEF